MTDTLTSRIELIVRDYECDVQGIVNNAVYLNYLEHARHRHLLNLDIDFVEMAAHGSNMVVTRIEVDYLKPLSTGDVFTVTSLMDRLSALRFVFRQDIHIQDGQHILSAVVTGTVIDPDGRPGIPPQLDSLLPAPPNSRLSAR